MHLNDNVIECNPAAPSCLPPACSDALPRLRCAVSTPSLPRSFLFFFCACTDNKVAAASLLGSAPLVDSTLDLYAAIVSQCGPPPYYGSKLDPNVTRHCSLINDNEEYHCEPHLF